MKVKGKSFHWLSMFSKLKKTTNHFKFFGTEAFLLPLFSSIDLLDLEHRIITDTFFTSLEAGVKIWAIFAEKAIWFIWNSHGQKIFDNEILHHSPLWNFIGNDKRWFKDANRADVAVKGNIFSWSYFVKLTEIIQCVDSYTHSVYYFSISA